MRGHFAGIDRRQPFSTGEELWWNSLAWPFVLSGRMPQVYSWPWVEAQCAETIEAWQECAGRLAAAAPQYSLKDHRQREKAYDDGLSAIERQVRRAPRGKSGRSAIQEQSIGAFARFSASALDLEPAAVALITGDFLPVGNEFTRRARHFDAGLSMAEIVQACRNAWTASGLQPLLGESMALSPSILGYSLLYPYSDNYLDGVDVSSQAKLRFSARFRARLRGEEMLPSDDREVAIWALVSLIEEQFPRVVFPQVYEALLAIHQAQEASIAQQRISGPCSDAEILRISCAKGGTSVLANACLARGWVSEQEARFSFQMGTLLQLGDDLQDLREDLERGSSTLFSAAAARGAALDDLVAQLLSFHERVAVGMDALPNGSPTLKRLLRTSWRLLILGAVAQAHEHFSPEFLSRMEASSPFRFAFLRDRTKKLAGRKGLYRTLFEAFLEENQESRSSEPAAYSSRMLYVPQV